MLLVTITLYMKARGIKVKRHQMKDVLIKLDHILV